MRTGIIVIIVLFTTLFYGQQTTLSKDLLVFPVSPEAAKLSKYGEVPVNLFTGQLNKSIELFNGKVGDFSLPINLSYNYAGNRLEESPSISGLGWQLSTGGVVTREIRGLPDEHPRGYNSDPSQRFLNRYINNERIRQFEVNAFASGFYDTEADKYSISVNGIRFSFKVGTDGTPVSLSEHNHKLRIIRNEGNPQIIEGFALTDTNANNYFFESKEINEPGNEYGSYFDENFMSYTSAWQLTKIIVNNGSEINFNYDTNNYTSYSSYANLQIRRPADFNYDPGYEEQYNEGFLTTVIRRKILRSITSSSFNINLEYVRLNNHEVYNSIIIKDLRDNIIDTYDFNYSENRNLLKKIDRNNQFFYEFDYFDEGSLPAFINSVANLPRNQDEWGFANGANNRYSIFLSGLRSQYNADKRPSYLHTVKGALTTIKYPTGGFTRIEYEQNAVHDDGTGEPIPNVRINLKFKTEFTSNAPPVKEQTFTKTFNRDVVANLSHYIQNMNYLDVSIRRLPGGPTGRLPYQGPGQHHPYHIQVPHVRSMTGLNNIPIIASLNEMAAHDNACEGFNNCEKMGNSSGNFILAAGTYEFKMRSEYNRTQDVRAEILLDFYDPEVAVYTRSVSYTPTGGIRVKQTADYPLNGDPLIKNYDYGEAYPFSVLRLNYVTHKYETCCIDSPGFDRLPTVSNVMEVTSQAHNLLLHSNSPVFYGSVIERTNRTESFTPERFDCNNCEGPFRNWDGSATYSYTAGIYGLKTYIYPEGYKQSDFETRLLKVNDNAFPFYPVGADLSIGALKSSFVYSKNERNTPNELLSAHTNNYFNTDSPYLPDSPNFSHPVLNNPNYPKSLKVDFKVRIVDNSPIQAPITIRDIFYFKIYGDYDVERYVNRTTTTEHFNGQVVEKNAVIEYDTHYQQKKVTTSDSNNNTIVNEMYYPYDFTDAVSQDMIVKNCIAPIVKVVNKKNRDVLNSFKYDYASIGYNLFKPSAFLTSKSNDVLEKVKEYGYDFKGNVNYIRDYATNTPPRVPHNDPSVIIIWGYNQTLPIARIENGTNAFLELPIAHLQFISDTRPEAELILALDALRVTLPDAMVTTYTYKPLVGISTMTDPKGNRMTYVYDSFNRLAAVRDKDNNILSENQYHYRTQN